MKKFVLDVPFEWRAWASAQKVRWDADAKAMIYTGESLPETLSPFIAPVFSWEWVQEQTLNDRWDLPNPNPTWKARPHQIKAEQSIERAYRAQAPGFLLADDVGLGKTISAWSFALNQDWAQRILIVCPLAVMAHWRNTLLHLGHGNRRTLIINYDRLGKLFDTPGKTLSSPRKKGRQKRLAREGEAPEFDLIIFDESHKCKNLESARSKLSQKLTQKAHFVIWASATAGQTPLELAYLTPLLSHITGARRSTMTDFEIWCQDQGLGVRRGAFGKWEWDRSAEDLAKIKSWLFEGQSPVGIRRLPSDISGWKELERQLTPVDLDAEARMAYQKEWGVFRQEEMDAKKARRGEISPGKSGAGKTSPKNHKADALVRRLRLRQKSSWLRVASTVQMIQDALDNGQQVAVSVAFHDTMNEIARLMEKNGISCALIHGKMTATEKEEERLRFQKEEIPLILFTVEEGISLHQGEHGNKPRTLFVHDLRWSAIQMAQIEGRCHRDGFFAPSVWLLATRTVEMRIAQVLVGRISAMKSMMGDDVETLLEIEKILLESPEYWEIE